MTLPAGIKHVAPALQAATPLASTPQGWVASTKAGLLRSPLARATAV